MQIIPLQAVKSQTLNIQLAGQYVTLTVYEKFFGVFCDVFVSGQPVVYGAICQNRNRLIRSTYLGFVGDLIFIDNQGNSDPQYTGLGNRFSLAYLEAADLAV